MYFFFGLPPTPPFFFLFSSLPFGHYDSAKFLDDTPSHRLTTRVELPRMYVCLGEKTDATRKDHDHDSPPHPPIATACFSVRVRPDARTVCYQEEDYYQPLVSWKRRHWR